MSTPGRRRALRALGRRKRANVSRVARGLKPILGGKKVTLATFNRKTGAGLSRRTARQRQKQNRKG